MPDPPRRFVLVTGADSGIGRAVVARLTYRGFHVIAGCQTPAAFWDLPADSHQRLSKVTVDIADSESCCQMANQVEAITAKHGLYAIFNNAGIALGGPQEVLDATVWRQQFDINVFGTVTITRLLLPQLRLAVNSRIVNMGSICSLISFPFVGPYCASKHAISAITMSLRGELRPWGIQAAMIAPGLVNTNLWTQVDQTTRAQLTNYSAQHREWYGRRIERRLARTIAQAQQGLTPDRVARSVESVICRQYLRPRYLVGWDARLLYWGDRLVPNLRGTQFLRRRCGLPS